MISACLMIDLRRQVRLKTLALVIAIFNVTMIGRPAQPVIKKMCRYNKKNSGNQKPALIKIKEFFEYQEYKTKGKNQKWKKTAMMLFISMPQGE